MFDDMEKDDKYSVPAYGPKKGINWGRWAFLTVVAMLAVAGFSISMVVITKPRQVVSTPTIEGSFTARLVGSNGLSPNLTLQFEKIGNNIAMEAPAWNGSCDTPSTTLVTTDAIPNKFRPINEDGDYVSSPFDVVATYTQNGGYSLGSVHVNTSGSVIIHYNSFSGYWNGTCSFDAFRLEYFKLETVTKLPPISPSPTPSVTPTPSRTPSVTPTPSRTPSRTPSPSPA